MWLPELRYGSAVHLIIAVARGCSLNRFSHNDTASADAPPLTRPHGIPLPAVDHGLRVPLLMSQDLKARMLLKPGLEHSNPS